MRKTRTALLAVAVSAVTVFAGGTALASSHREAPFLTENPKVDGTDFYVFRSYETGKDTNVTFLANYLPLQDGYGGPNFFTMDPDALYEIMVDNNADGVEDLTFQFRFTTTFTDIPLPVGDATSMKMNSVPLYNIGQIIGVAGDAANRTVTETYTVGVVTGPRRGSAAVLATNMTDGGTTFPKPADLVGQKTTPDYDTYSKGFIKDITIPGCADPGRVFVGQRKDPFVVNLGEIFDLINIDVGDASGATMCDATQQRDVLGAKNVTGIAIEVPISCLKSANDKVIASWTTASLRQARALNPKATFDKPAKEGGAWTQVSRLGAPLVNEVVIGLKDKNRFNSSVPTEDATLFLDYVTHPTISKIVGIVFEPAVGINLEPQVFPRNDLVAAFLSGLPMLNLPDTSPATPYEALRLNVEIPVRPAAMQDRLAALAGDVAGFPNGRRPIDDVVDIELRAAMGALLDPMMFPDPIVPARSIPLTDCAPTAAGFYDETFPYMKSPIPGSRVTPPG